ncbi:MAG: hypothetical protein A3E84_04230 [Gammaproteobacteria bacterium RIFCSPHIGHO2_12_FULL_42_13]|nr:MAG: hypothetical protein A3E84_04230 [Gammaproteobacteria bacterium RIFCSPHIGHO2_12_FULL_42_13]
MPTPLPLSPIYLCLPPDIYVSVNERVSAFFYYLRGLEPKTLNSNYANLLISAFADPKFLGLKLGNENNNLHCILETFFLQECHCTKSLERRSPSHNMRFLINLLVGWWAILTGKKSIHLASFGSGGLLQELSLIAFLVRSGIQRIHIDLIDLIYSNQSELHRTVQIVITNFMLILNTGMGLHAATIPPSSDTEIDECSAANNTNPAVKTKGAQKTHSQKNHRVTVTFFSSMGNYTERLKKGQKKPQIVIGVDIGIYNPAKYPFTNPAILSATTLEESFRALITSDSSIFSGAVIFAGTKMVHPEPEKAEKCCLGLSCAVFVDGGIEQLRLPGDARGDYSVLTPELNQFC